MIYSIGKFLFQVYNLLWYRYTVEGKENIPATGGCIICPNHVNWYDPIVICTKVRRPVHFMAKAELYKNGFVNWILRKVNTFPVERDKVSVETLKHSLKILKDGEVLGIFPEGTRMKNGERKKPMAGAVVFALKTHTPIVPVFIEGNFKFRGRIHVIFGKPIELTEFYGKKLKQDEMDAISLDIMDQIYLMGDGESTPKALK